MKKYVALVIFTLAFPVFALATSGACSGHGGVNCAAGEDRDGSVICKDGWRNSSVQYSSMVMCAGYDTPKEKPVSSEPKLVVPTIAVPITKDDVKKINSEKPTQSVSVAKTLPVAPAKVQLKKEVASVSSPQSKAVERVSEEKVESIPVVSAQKKVGFWSKMFGFIF